MSDRKDLPPASAPNFESRVREAVMTYLGRIGDPLDRGVTLRDLLDSGLAKLRAGRTVASLGNSGSALPIELPPAREVEPDLTPPPPPTGFAVSAAISNIFIEHDSPTYLQGHGHLRTRVYGKIMAEDDPLPAFEDAVEITQFTGRVHAHPSNPATTWRLWIKWESRDGVLSVSPAGGTNGLEVVTGQDVSLLLEALTGEITESQLFQDLGDRISLIDEPTTGLVAQVENVKGKYTVKIDNAGHVSGYGLASSPNDATPTSEFGIRADKFWVAGASTASSTEPTTDLYKGRVWRDTSVTPNVTRYYTGSAWSTTPQSNVFAVLNAPGTINGVSVPAGVYIDTAFIGNATIKSAQIGSVAADTIQAGYTTSVDLESATFFGSDFYIGGTVVYEYDDPTDPQRKTGIASVVNPAIALKGGATPTAEFTVDSFKVKTSANVGAIPLLTVSGNTVRINFNQLSNTLGDLGFTGDSNATKNTIWQQASAPSNGVSAGDIWIDTDDNNKLYLRSGNAWVLRRDAGVDAALEAAANAQDTADGKIETYYQTSAPTSGMSLGDLWFDTNDGNKLYRYSGSAWVAAQDSGIASAINNAASAQATADGKIVTFFSTTTPASASFGDLWYSDETKLLKRWDGSSWLTVSNSYTNTNQLTDGAGLGATANWVQVAGRPETLAALDATAAADLDGKTITFYQASEPTGTVNDLWFDTDDGNKLYRHDGTSWVAVQDAGIAAAALLATAAQGTADSKITTFYTTTTPTATTVGDLWYSTSTKLLKRWDGSVWVDAASMGAPSGTLVGSTSADDVESNAANGNAAYTAITDSSTGLATKLANNASNALTGSAGLVAGTLAWDSSGVRTSGFGVAMTSAGIAAYKSDGNASFALNASDGSATFAGALSAATGTFAGALSAATGTFAGSVNGGAFTGYAWPAAGQQGFHLGPSGLLIGNFNTVQSSGLRRYVEISSNGTMNLSGQFGIDTTGRVYADTADIRRRIVLENGVYDTAEFVQGSYQDGSDSPQTFYYQPGTTFPVRTVQVRIPTNIFDANVRSQSANQPYYVAASATGPFRNWVGTNGSTFYIAVFGNVGVQRTFSNSGNFEDDHRILITLSFQVTLVTGQFTQFRMPQIEWTLFKL